MRAKSRTTRWDNTQEQSEVLSSRCGQNWSFPASVKTEDIEYLLQHPTKEKIQAGLMCSDYLSLSFGCPLLVLAPGVSPGFLASAGLNRIRGFPRLEFCEFVTATACVYFIPSRFSLMFDVLHTVINSVRATCQQSTPTSVVTDCLSWVYDPYTHACNARPLTIVGRTSLSVIITFEHVNPIAGTLSF